MSKALVVRGGWEGHQPVKATELFIPFLERSGYAVRVEESTEVYADAAEMAGTDLVVQCVTMSQITARAAGGAERGGRGRHRASPAGTAASPTRSARRPTTSTWSAASSRPTRARNRASVTAAPEDNFLPHTVNITDARPGAPDHRGHRGLRPGHRAVLGAPRRPDRRPGHHHPSDAAVAAVAPAGHLAGDLDPPVGCRAHRRDDAGAQPRRAGAPERPYRHREGHAVGDPHRVGVVGLGVISRAVPRHARRPSRGARHRGRRPRRLPVGRGRRRAPRRRGADRRAAARQPGRATRCSTSRSPRRTPRSRSARSATARTSTARSRWPPRSPDARSIIDAAAAAGVRRGLRAGHRAGHRHPDGAGGDRRRAHRAPAVRVGRHGHARATNAGTPTPTSTTPPAAARCWTWGRTTSRRWSTCSARSGR